MSRIRGIVMLIAGVFALYEAWRVLSGQRAVLALILGLVALALAAWHLTRKEPKRLS
jgi:drug/metabolite transporter superfamily protein YnfA